MCVMMIITAVTTSVSVFNNGCVNSSYRNMFLLLICMGTLSPLCALLVLLDWKAVCEITPSVLSACPLGVCHRLSFNENRIILLLSSSKDRKPPGSRHIPVCVVKKSGRTLEPQRGKDSDGWASEKRWRWRRKTHRQKEMCFNRRIFTS